MRLAVELCDLEQNVLTRLDNRREGTKVELGLNKMRTGFCPLSLEDPALALASAVETVLRVTLIGPDDFELPLLCARIYVPALKEEADNNELALNALDPMFQLEDALVRDADSTPGYWVSRSFAQVDQSAIMWALIAHAEGHGVVVGDFDTYPSILRDRTYPPGKEVTLALTQMSEVIGGPDFEFEPVHRNDGTLCRFNTFYPQQGTDKSADVVFEIGGGLENATHFTEAPAGDQLVNRWLVIGAAAEETEASEPFGGTKYPAYVAQHDDSIEQYGPFEKKAVFEDVTEIDTLKEHAEALVAASASVVPFFDFIAAPEQDDEDETDGVPPRFGIDYWIGDTIAVKAWVGGRWVGGLYLDEQDEELAPRELKGRVVDATVVELESGQIVVKVTCETQQSSAGITGEAITLLMPEGEEV